MKRLVALTISALLAFSLACFSQEKVYFSNAKEIPSIMKEFVDGAVYYNIDYKKQLEQLEVIRVIPGEKSFLGRIEGNTILLNEDLLQFPNLFRVVLFRQLGKFYGLEAETSSRLTVMSKRWEMSPQYELYAYNLNTRYWFKEKFYRKLSVKHSYQKQI